MKPRTWAPATEESIRAALQKAASGRGTYSLEKMRCLTRLCSVELTLPNMDSPQRAMQSFPMFVENMEGFRTSTPTQDSDGKFRMRIEFYRPGYEEP
jgi:hypothetical protein